MRIFRRTAILAAAAEHDARGAFASLFGYQRHGPPICLVTHDAFRHGAQLLILGVARIFSRAFGLKVHIVLLGPGPLATQFRRYGHIYHVDAQNSVEMELLVARLKRNGVDRAICNSTASGLFVEALTSAGVETVVLVHELPELIANKRLGPHVEAIHRSNARAVFPSTYVRDRFPGGPPRRSLLRAQGMLKRCGLVDADMRAHARTLLARRHKIPLDARIVLNAGYGDARKGLDIFLEVGARVIGDRTDVYFVWLGDIAPEMNETIQRFLAASPCATRFVFAPFTKDFLPYFVAADVFALTSREDPYPTVLLNALDAGLPVVAFAEAGGFGELLERAEGERAAMGDIAGFSVSVSNLLAGVARRPSRAVQARAAVADQSIWEYAFDLAELVEANPPRVSVVVPNYNYARYLQARLRSVLRQTVPVFELIVIDDCSTDDSLEVARRALKGDEPQSRIVPGIDKATSVFAQWRRGVEEARGDFVWIAEADDLADPRFLAAVLPAFKDPAVVLSYCQSRQLDENGRVIETDYRTYVSDIDPKRWRAPFVADGNYEIRTSLAVKNTLPNVSACVFRRTELATTLARHFEEITNFRIAGDWMTYVRLLDGARLAYDPRPLNHHRRHRKSVTAAALEASSALREIADLQELTAREYAVTPQTRALAHAYLRRTALELGVGVPK